MSVLWQLGQNQTNPGEQFQQGYRNALAMREHQQDRALQMQQMQAQQAQQKQQQAVQLTDRHRQDIRLGARIVRQINPTDDATWQRARIAAQQAGVDLADVPEHFDPNYVQQLLTAGQQLDSMEPGYTLGAGDTRFDASGRQIATGGPDVTHQPNIQREVDYYRSIGRDDLAQQLLRNHAEGSPVVFDINHDGAPDLVPRSYFNNGGAPSPATGTFQDGDTETINGIPYVRRGGQWVPQSSQAAPPQGGAAPAFSADVPLTVEDRRNQYPSHAPGRGGSQGPRTFR